MNSARPVLREVANCSANPFWDIYQESELLPSHIMRSEGVTSGGAAGLYRLFDEMEEKDGHLFSTLQTRKVGVLRCPRKMLPASDSPADAEVARFVEKVLHRIAGFDQSLLHILDALGKGLSVQEIIWEQRGSEVFIKELKSLSPGRFQIDRSGALHLRQACLSLASEQTGLSRAVGGSKLPDRKFLRFTFGGLYGNPYGRGLDLRAYWYYWFKKNNLKFWVIFNEKFGSPTVVGKYRPGSSEEDRKRLFEVIESLQNDTGVAIPDSISLELLEAQRSGNASTYQALADWCNDEISKIVLGATLTSGEGRRSGSNALGRVHERVRSEYVEVDARALENVLNSQLVRWLVDFNFGPHVEAPRLQFVTSLDDTQAKDMEVDRQLLSAGVSLPQKYFYERYGRPAPRDGEAALRYDDQNLFQYHLRFGVLTINEARERLGLAPVDWGEERVRPLGSEKPEIGAGEPNDGAAEQLGPTGPDGREDPLELEEKVGEQEKRSQ